MRIAHVTATFPPYYGGTGTVCYHNALGLARSGHDVTVFTAAYPNGEASDPPGVTVRRLGTLCRIGNAPLLPGLLALKGFDIVHLHYPFYFGAESIFLQSMVRGLRYVMTYHQDVLFDGLLRVPAQLHHRWMGTWTLNRAEKVFATSLDYARASRLGALMAQRSDAIIEMPNGVDAQKFHPASNPGGLRERYGLPPEDLVVLFVGALDRAHYFKGVDVLLQALARIRPPGVRLLVVGDGDLRSTSERQASELGLAGWVTFCGRVPDEELPAHYALCDLLVLPSTTMGEAFGVVLLEAMATGKPVIASRLPGVRSVVGDGEVGLLAQPGDVDDLAGKMQWLLDHPDRALQMGTRGRAKVEARYDWPVIIPRLERVYEQVLQGA